MLLPLLLSSWLLASILDINMDLNKYLLNEPLKIPGMHRTMA